MRVKIISIIITCLLTTTIVSCKDEDIKITSTPTPIEVFTKEESKETPSQTNDIKDNTKQTTASPSSVLSTEQNQIDKRLQEQIANAKAQYYYIEEFVGAYIRGFIFASNDKNYIKQLEDSLEKDSPLYIKELKNINENLKLGKELKLVYDYLYEDTKESSKNEYKVFMRIELEIKNPDGSIETKVEKKIYTVFDDGKERKIINIETLE